MTKRDLILKLQNVLQIYTYKDITHAVNIIFDSMVHALKQGERIEIRGFGSIMVRERGARLGRNPKSGGEVKLEKRKAPFFKAGKDLRIKVDYKFN
ncbi:MAG: HU family DNA-binding protein [Smithella sp.]